MEKSIYKIISFLSHPLLLPTYAVLLIFNLPTYISLYPTAIKNIIYFIVFLTTFVLPALSVVLMVNLRIINKLTLEDRKERFFPMLITGSFLIVAYVLINSIPHISIPRSVGLFLLIASISVFLSLIINFKLKISVHMVGVGALLSYFIVFTYIMNISGFFTVIGLILFASVIGFVRLSLNAHTPLQVHVGFFVGLVSGSSAYFFFL